MKPWALTARQASMLREMNLAPLWRLRGREVSVVPEPGLLDEVQAITSPTRTEAVAPALGQAAEAASRVANVLPADAGLRQVWPDGASAQRRASEASPPMGKLLPEPLSPAPREATPDVAGADWMELEARIHACKSCGLCESRLQAVVGTGERRARWMFVGEAPGQEEDRAGLPFVGLAGQLLDAMLAALGLRRGEDVYIANAVKCRPPFNRTPMPEEIHACLPYLQRQIELVQPQLILALGRPAAYALLGQEVKINAVRGQVFERDGVPVVVSYHPAYLLRNPADKSRAWEDLLFARRVLTARSQNLD